MKINITINEGTKRVSAIISGKDINQSFEGLTFFMAVHKLKDMLDEHNERSKSIKERVSDIVANAPFGRWVETEILSKDLANFRVRISVESKEQGINIKTKLINNSLYIKRV